MRLAVLLIAGLALFVWFLRQRAQEPLTIENRSLQVITRLSVSRGDKTITSGLEEERPFVAGRKLLRVNIGPGAVIAPVAD